MFKRTQRRSKNLNTVLYVTTLVSTLAACGLEPLPGRYIALLCLVPVIPVSIALMPLNTRLQNPALTVATTIELVAAPLYAALLCTACGISGFLALVVL